METQRQKFIDDLEKVFTLAIEAKDLRTALKAKELLGKMLGFFRAPPVQEKKTSGDTAPTLSLAHAFQNSTHAIEAKNRAERRRLEKMKRRA